MEQRLARILILSYTPIARSPRVLRQIAEFRGRYHVTTAGYGPAPDGVDDHIELRFPPINRGLARVPGIFTGLLLARCYRSYCRLEPVDSQAYAQLADREWDVVVAHDAQTLHLASRLRSRRGVLADMHEYAPEQNERTVKWIVRDRPYFVWLCRTFLPRMAAVTTVSSGIADAYRETFGVHADLVANATPHHDLSPSPMGSVIRLVHSGVAAPDRRLDVLIRAVLAAKSDISLDLYLVDGTDGYRDELEALTGGDPRIRFREPVPYRDLVPTLNQYDVGVHVIAPTSFNNLWSLPNKFFDYIQARLAVLIGPSPAMVPYVERHGLGKVIAGFSVDDLVAGLDALRPSDVQRWKNAAHASARELSGESHAAVWGTIVDRMIAA